MRKEHLASWLNALRGDEYVQGTGTLMIQNFNDDGEVCQAGHCCLGVLADVLAKQFPEFLEENRMEVKTSIVTDHRQHMEVVLRGAAGRQRDVTTGTLHPFADILGLPRQFQQELTRWNDAGMDFKSIAGQIEMFFAAE